MFNPKDMEAFNSRK